jgi:hypothetical protein
MNDNNATADFAAVDSAILQKKDRASEIDDAIAAIQSTLELLVTSGDSSTLTSAQGYADTIGATPPKINSVPVMFELP